MKKLTAVFMFMFVVVVGSHAMAATGEELFKSCAGCHGADGSKPTGGSTALRGQSADELMRKMNGYLDGSFGGEKKNVMTNILKKHTPEDLKMLADHISKL